MRLFNTLTREKEEFIPISDNKVSMYVCGPTVYNQMHLGNARPVVMFDTLRRFLEYRGYAVDFVQNFTDIDDKMIRRAQEENTTVSALADKYIGEYFLDADGLGVKRATQHPLATQNMDAIIELIRLLVEQGFAYEAEDGVYFDVSKDEAYGKLSHHNLEDLVAGASERVSVDENKRSPADFAVWKKKKPGEPAWESPWGEGRPGWHIECSAMIRKHFGDTIDIHCGGQDLTFPHHENEIAQSECATGKPFVRYWVHNGFITVDNEKMSKSSDNFFMVRDIASVYPYQVIRFFLLTAHYRMPINYNLELMTAAQSGLQRIQTCVENLDFAAEQRNGQDASELNGAVLTDACRQHHDGFVAAMEDDMNTADAIASVFELVRLANTSAADKDTPAEALSETAATIRELCGVLGLDLQSDKEATPVEIEKLVQERVEAKQSHDFASADAIRDKVRGMGYVIEDTPEGPRVFRA